MKGTALVICGALGREVKEIVDRRGWDVDIYGVSALLHLYPSRILDELREKLHRLRPDYDKLVVVYGECGMNEKLDSLLEEVGATRLRGPHCYEMYAGEDRFAAISTERPATFFLTDWLVRNFDRAVVKGLGLDRDPELIPMLFGNYESVLYLRQSRHPRLAVKAAEIASYLGLRLEVEDVGMGELETRLAVLMEGNPPPGPLRGPTSPHGGEVKGLPLPRAAVRKRSATSPHGGEVNGPSPHGGEVLQKAPLSPTLPPAGGGGLTQAL